LKLKEDHGVNLFKLIGMTILHIIGIATGCYALWGGKSKATSFEDTRLLVGIGSFAYVVGLTGYNYIVQYRYAPSFYRTKPRNHKAIWLRSGIKCPAAIYCLDVVCAEAHARSVVARIEIPVCAWIDEEGRLCGEAIHRDLTAKLAPKCLQ